jgi:hypothetical protein
MRDKGKERAESVPFSDLKAAIATAKKEKERFRELNERLEEKLVVLDILEMHFHEVWPEGDVIVRIIRRKPELAPECPEHYIEVESERFG